MKTKIKSNTWKQCAIQDCHRKAVDGKYCAKHGEEQRSPEYTNLNLAKQEQVKAQEAAEAARKAAEEAAQEVDPLFPVDSVERLTELEAMTYRAMEAEVRAADLMVKNIRHERVVADRELERTVLRHQAAQAQRQQQLEQMTAEFDRVKQHYLDTVTEMASKRGLDPKMMAIDPEARTVRDLRGEAADPPTTVQ
jgi:hypothetical protein